MNALRVAGLDVFYGQSQALFGVSIQVDASQVITLLGRNGMGKSTTVHAVMGLARPRRGSIEIAGEDRTRSQPHEISRAGVALVPEGRQIFPRLTVRENLVATARPSAGTSGWTLERVYGLFPRLREREHQSGASLSGGEQQMLAIGRALLTNPWLLILDEATEGLAPLVRADIWRCIEVLKAEGMAMIIVDKHLEPLMRLADRHYVLEKGRVVWDGGSTRLRAEVSELREYLGV